MAENINAKPESAITEDTVELIVRRLLDSHKDEKTKAAKVSK